MLLVAKRTSKNHVELAIGLKCRLTLQFNYSKDGYEIAKGKTRYIRLSFVRAVRFYYRFNGVETSVEWPKLSLSRRIWHARHVRIYCGTLGIR